MIAQRTTLMTLCFLAILLGRNALSSDMINILWTGVSAPYQEVKLGLIIVISIYSLNYLWRWFAEYDYITLKAAHTYAERSDFINFKIGEWEQHDYFKVEFPSRMEEAEKRKSELFYEARDELAQIGKLMTKSMVARTRLERVHFIVFTLVVPALLSLLSLYVLTKSG